MPKTFTQISKYQTDKHLNLFSLETQRASGEHAAGNKILQVDLTIWIPVLYFS